MNHRSPLLIVLLLAAVTAGAVPVIAQNPITAAREAFRKAMEEQKRKQEEQKKQQTAPPPAAAPAASQPAPVEPVTLEDLAGSASPPAPAVPVDPKVMPDIVGIHLGMSLKEADAALRSQYPKGVFNYWDAPLLIIPKVVYGESLNYRSIGFEDQITFDLTLPPEPQVVWRVGRMAQRQHVNRGTLLAALRQKYGKETWGGYSDGGTGQQARNDSEIVQMLWMYDEQGRPAPMTRTERCRVGFGTESESMGSLIEEARGNPPRWPKGPCASLVGVEVTFSGPEEIIETVYTGMLHVPLAIRTSHATAVWWKAIEEKQRLDEIEKSKAAKPKL